MNKAKRSPNKMYGPRYCAASYVMSKGRAKPQQAHNPIYNKLERPVFNKLESRNHNKQSAYRLRPEWATAHSQNIVQQPTLRAKTGRSLQIILGVYI
ncbi:hypothetical protein [Hoylesella timonensis]|nr:hypothetical protein [Hoylesella timonensis]